MCIRDSGTAYTISYNCYDDRCQSPGNWKVDTVYKFPFKRIQSYAMFIPESMAKCEEWTESVIRQFSIQHYNPFAMLLIRNYVYSNYAWKKSWYQ